MRVSMIDPSLFTLPYDQALATGMEAAGHRVTLFGRRPGPFDSNPPGVKLEHEFYRFTGSRIVSALPAKLRLAVKGVDHVWSMARLLRRLRRERPDVIHFQWLPLPVVDSRMLAGFRRVAPLVLTVHDTNPFNGDPSARLQTLGVLRCLQQFGRLIVHTDQGRGRLQAQGVDPARLVVLPHGPMPAAGRGGPDPMLGRLTFTLFGKIKPYKGADVLIEAFAQLPPELRGQAQVRIIGKSYMDLAPLEALIRQHGLEGQVRIEDCFVADDDLPEVFGPGVVALFPYREIDTSGVLPQALAHGRPVVASGIGVFAETLRDGEHGHLAPPEDPVALSAALAHLIRDRGFAAGCARSALELSESGMSWQRIAERTVAAYRDASA